MTIYFYVDIQIINFNSLNNEQVQNNLLCKHLFETKTFYKLGENAKCQILNNLINVIFGTNASIIQNDLVSFNINVMKRVGSQ